MIYSALTELAFENALQQLMESFNVDGEYIVDHLISSGKYESNEDEVGKLEEELEDAKNEL